MAKTNQTRPRGYKFQYAAKFICTSSIPGTSQTSDAVVPGSYQTAVNIHNPHPVKVKLRKKIASPIGISKYFEFVLEPDGVARITCAQIHEFGLHLIHGFEGFLVVESAQSVDVIAVYTAAGKEKVSSIDVENVRERKL